MQSIVTKYLPPTDRKGGRIKATCQRGSITIDYPHELREGEPCHRLAAHALVHRFLAEDEKKYGPEANKPGTGWRRAFVSGCLPDGSWAHVFIG